MITSPTPSITGVILAGGRARRMGGEDKGLILYQQQPLISYAIKALEPQVDHLIINANRNIDKYQTFNHPIIKDSLDGFCGPLAGMLSAMQTATTDYILTCPCDCPSISPQLRQRLMESLLLSSAEIAVAFDGNRLQPVFSLIPCHLQEDLQTYLLEGERKIDLWFQRHKLSVVDFSDQPDTFSNINHPEELITPEAPLTSAVPLLGFSAFSGTGKTTLLRQLLPVLKEQGLKVAVIKHAHHKFDIDKPGKDSYELRKAGAQQMLIASCNLMALMETQPAELDEPRLANLLPRLDKNNLDLILVEGFKHEAIPKIELHRPSLEKPLLHPDDTNIIAIASDEKLNLDSAIEQLDLNDVDALINFIHLHIKHWTQ
jgi:molybdenum cofactor guanylyltransferase/molybdopterin-guanine dinucleotide biosynthesis protein MobB